MTYVYVRHSETCPYRDQPTYKRCKCPKWIYHDRARLSAKTRSWEKADARAKELEAGATKNQAQRVDTRVTVAHAVERYLQTAKDRGAGPATLEKKERTFKGPCKTSPALLEWCESHSFKFITELGTEECIRWRSKWQGATITRFKKQGMVAGFFYFCMRLKWITSNPMLDVGAIKVQTKPTGYFPPNEFEAILRAITFSRPSRRESAEPAENHRDGRWSDSDRERCRVLTLLMRWSGLSIRDAVCLQRDRLGEDDSLFLYRAKTGQPVRVLLPPEVASALRSVPSGKNTSPNYFLWSGNGLPKTAVADWQRVYRRVFADANLPVDPATGKTKRAHPHMFRDTFAVEMLLSGATIDQVAMLLGHSNPATTAKSYMPWVKARQEQLDLAVKRSWTLAKTDSGTRRVV